MDNQKLIFQPAAIGYNSFKEQAVSSQSVQIRETKVSLRTLIATGDSNSITRKYILAMLCIASFGAGCGFSVFAPFYPQEAKKKGATDTAIGFVFSIFELAMFIGSPIYGNYLSAIGPKRMYASGIVVAGLCSITFGFLNLAPSGAVYITLCLTSRALEGLGIAAFFTSSQAIIVHYFPDHVGACFAVQETFYAIGMMIAPSIGGALFEAGGFGLPFWIIGGVIVISGMIVMVYLPNPQDCGPRHGSIFTLLRSPRVLCAALVILTGATGSGFLQPMLAEHMSGFGLTSMHVSLTFLVVPGIHALFSPLWGLIIDRWDLKAPVQMVGLTVGLLAFLFIGPTSLFPALNGQLWPVYLGLAMFGVTFGCTIVPAVPSMLAGCSEIGLPDNLDTYGLVCGMFNSVFCLGTFLGPSVGGVMVDNLGFETSSSIISGMFLFSLLISSNYFLFDACQSRRKKYSERLPLID